MQLAQQVEPTKFVISVSNAANINHIAIFLLPQSEFTDNSYTALVYFQLPNSSEFKLLGGINPARPSAIYRLNTSTLSTSHLADEDDVMKDADAQNDVVLNIGIAIEPTAQAELLLLQEKLKVKTIMPAPSKAAAPSAPQDIAGLANKIVSHAYNFLGGFVDSSGKVPMKVFDNWWDKFKQKLANNPKFLEQLD